MTETEHEPEDHPTDAPVDPTDPATTAPEPPPDPQDLPEPEEPENASQSVTEVEMEKRLSKVSASFTTYKNAVERNLEEAALDLVGCPLCYGTSHPAFMNKHDMGNVPEAVQDNVRFFLGLAREQDYEQDPQVNTCPTCKGKTRTKTGSLSGDHMTRVCPTCKGYGYVPPPGAQQATNGAVDEPHVVAPDVSGDFPEEERDPWGEPRVLPDGTLNDNFMRLPQGKKVHPVYGVTANLNVLDAV